VVRMIYSKELDIAIGQAINLLAKEAIANRVPILQNITEEKVMEVTKQILQCRSYIITNMMKM